MEINIDTLWKLYIIIHYGDLDASQTEERMEI